MRRSILALAVILGTIFCARAQSHTQSIRGTGLDIDTQQPLIGANIFVEKTIPLLGATTDIDRWTSRRWQNQ